MSDRQTVASAYARADAAHLRMDGHEDLCAERYKNLHGAIEGLQKLLWKVGWGVVTTMVGLLGWLAVQLWSGQVTHPGNPPAIVETPQ